MAATHAKVVRESTSETILAHPEPRTADTEAEQVRRMDALARLAGVVAHDFNNLLTIIIGNAEILRDEVADNPDRSDMVDTVLEAAERASSLTQTLLDFAGRQPIAAATVSLRRLLQDITARLEQTAGDAVAVTSEVAADLWDVSTDARELEAVLVGLVTNAREAMPGGGTLRIGARNAEVPDGSAGLAAGDYGVIVIEDDGPGIASELAGRATEPFVTTKTDHKGKGLGLSMAYSLARQSGGHLTVASEPGAGTAVRIYLPRSASQSLLTGLRP
jgi:signal transduction histidine kinase